MSRDSEPIIVNLPSVDEFTDMMDVVLEAGLEDGQIAALIKLVMTPANAEDDTQLGLANAVARRAYVRTSHFERAFSEFTGHPRYAPLRSEKIAIDAAADMEM